MDIYYDGWGGEYWIDVTDKAWQEHLIDEAKKIKAYCLAKGWDVYFSKHKELRGD